VFVPIFDDNPLRSIRHAYVTISLIVLNTAVFLLELTVPGQIAAASFAIVPAELLNAGTRPAWGAHDAYAVPEALTLVSYMFLHGDPLHLAGNMLFLWVFGDNVEDAMGHWKFLVFYLICGIVGGVVHATMVPASDVPLIGASGAVAGVIAAYLMLHPHVRVWIIAFRFIPLRISAMLALGAWVATQFVMLLIPNVGPVAWWAHVGGIITGALLITIMRRPGVPLFDRGRAPRPADLS
jgi:membrane associated rhomboid family serine protease